MLLFLKPLLWHFQNRDALPPYSRGRISDRGQKELQMMWLPWGERDRTIFQNYRLSRILLKLRKSSRPPSPLCHFPIRISACVQGQQREAYFDMCEEQAHSVEPQGLPWHLQTSPGLLGAGEGSRCPGLPLPITRGREWPGGISTVDAAAAFWVAQVRVGREALEK